MSRWEEKYEVGDNVSIDYNDLSFQGTVAFIDNNDRISYPYIVKVAEHIPAELSHFFWTPESLIRDFPYLLEGVVFEPGFYMWPTPEQIKLSTMKYDLERTTFLEGVEL